MLAKISQDRWKLSEKQRFDYSYVKRGMKLLFLTNIGFCLIYFFKNPSYMFPETLPLGSKGAIFRPIRSKRRVASSFL